MPNVNGIVSLEPLGHLDRYNMWRGWDGKDGWNAAGVTALKFKPPGWNCQPVPITDKTFVSRRHCLENETTKAPYLSLSPPDRDLPIRARYSSCCLLISY